MVDDLGDISAYYDRETEHEHGRLEKHQLEHDLTWRYLDRYLPPQGKLLEIGCATGRYTLELARRGYQLAALDLSPGNIERCRENLAAADLEGQVRLLEADARDLSRLKEEIFDAVLLMGPLYHLVEKADRMQALAQAYQHLRDGGLIFCAFICRFGLMGDMMKNVPGWIFDQPDVRSVLDHGKDPPDHPRGGFRGYFVKPSEIAPLNEEAGFSTLVVAAVEPAISADDESYNRLQGEERRRWLEVLFELSSEPSMLGASRHLLYIGKK
jgi:SAM-dependent methyltransferase